MTIVRYGVEYGTYDSGPVYNERNYEEAKVEALEHRGRVIAYEFELSDSYLVDDFVGG